MITDGVTGRTGGKVKRQVSKKLYRKGNAKAKMPKMPKAKKMPKTMPASAKMPMPKMQRRSMVIAQRKRRIAKK